MTSSVLSVLAMKVLLCSGSKQAAIIRYETGVLFRNF